MSEHTDEEIISAYLHNGQTGEIESFWAFEEVNALLRQDTERAWNLTCQMIERVSDNRMLAYIAAGPLEDILAVYGKDYIAKVEARAKTNAHFRRALACVWLKKEAMPEIFKRVEIACSGVEKF